MIPHGLYYAKKTMHNNNTPYRKVIIMKCKDDKVLFATEWPVQKIEMTVKEFFEKFEKCSI